MVAASFLIGYALAATVSWIFFVALLRPARAEPPLQRGVQAPFIGVIGTSKLKQKLLLKNVSIALGWSLIPILVGIYFGGFDLPLLLLGPFIFLRLMTNTIIFDIRDTEGDHENAVKTLPTELGVSRSFNVVGVIDALSAAYLRPVARGRARPVVRGDPHAAPDLLHDLQGVRDAGRRQPELHLRRHRRRRIHTLGTADILWQAIHLTATERRRQRPLQESNQNPLILRYKQEVEKRLSDIYGSDGWISAAASEAIRAGGKRLRPILAILACEAICGNPEPAFPVALAYELAHSASLIQDNIIDESAVRHGSPTTYNRYGLARAIMLSRQQ